MILLTILTFLFVLVSLGLVVAVPVVLATPDEWESSKDNFNNFFRFWASLVFGIALADGINSSI